MRVNPRELICGLRPILVRQLAREYVSVGKASRYLGLSVPEARQKMIELCDAGWMKVDPADPDHWTASDQGRRLANAKLNVKPFPRGQGMQIVGAVVAEAELINGERHAYRIARVLLFGSCLSAKDDDLIGDVDLIITTERNPDLSDVEFHALKEQESDERSHPNYIAHLFWPRHRLLRRIKNLDRRISLQSEDDLALGFTFKQIFPLISDEMTNR